MELASLKYLTGMTAAIAALVLSSFATAAKAQIPIVTAGGSTTTLASTPASSNSLGSLAWEIENSSGSDVADSNLTLGWTLNYANGSFTVGAPSESDPLTTTAGTGYVAIWNDGSQSPPSATFNVDPMLTGFTLSPSTVIGSNSGGTVSTGTVTLNESPGAGGTNVYLQSANSVVNMASTVNIQQGSTSITFPVTSNAVAAQTTAQLTATLDSTVINQNLTINPWLASMTLSATSGVGGIQNPTVTVTLNAPAPAGGLTVNLTSSVTSALSSGVVTIGSGQSSASVTLTSAGVTTPTPLTISAQYDLVTLTQSYTVNPMIASLVLNPSTVVGQASSTGTVTLNCAAPSNLTLPLSSSAPSVASVPANVSIAQGATTGTFNISAATVSIVTEPGISVTYNGSVTQTVTANLFDEPLLGNITFNPSSVIGGNTSTGTITLNGPAPTGGTSVSVSSGNAGYAYFGTHVPTSTVTVPAGQTSQTFTINTMSTTSTVNVTFTATLGSTTKTTTLSVIPLTVTIGLSPSTVIGGNTSAGTVTLNAPAPSSLTISLTSSSGSATLSPPSITIASGSTTGSFTVNTSTVTTNSSATITGSYSGGSGSATLTIEPLLASMTLSPTSLVGGNGDTSTGTVTLNAAQASNTTVTLTSSNTADATVPASVVVPAGSTTATFTVSTSVVMANASATISAAYGGVSKTATLTVEPMLASLTINPASVFGGSISTGTVTLNEPAPGSVTVPLTNSNTAICSLPSSVTISSGATSAQFTISTVVVTSVGTSTITASYAGASSATTLTVTPLLSTLSLSPTSVVASQTSTGTVTLYGAAPSGGVVITVSSNATSVAAPAVASVTVPAGSTSSTFTVNTSLVTANSTATISATDGNVTRTAALAVDPLLAGIRLNGGSNSVNVVGGDAVGNCSVYFNLTAPAGVSLPVVSSNAAISNPTPSPISVSTGATSAAFTIPTYAVSTVTATTISSTYNGVTVTGTVTVHPMPTVTSVTFSTSPVIGGNNVTATIKLSDIAPAAGATVTLSSSNTSVATIPASVTVPSGSTSTTVTITTIPTAANATSVISASFNSSTSTGTLGVNRPNFTGISISPNSVTGGTGTTGTLTLNGKAPAVGVTINISASPANGISLSSYAVTIPSGATSTTFPIATSTVTSTTVITVTGSNSVASTETFSATINLGITLIHAVNVLMPQAIVLNWSTPAIGNYLLDRNHVQIASLPNTTTAYTDTFAWTIGQTYEYDLYDASNNALLGTEVCQPYQLASSQDQAVDGRLDPRYQQPPVVTAPTYLNNMFGSTCYNGGLFVGYASDPSQVGRSFAMFQPASYPSDAVYRAGSLDAYLVQGDIHGTGSITETVGAQAISNNSWSAPTLTWSTAPSITPSAAPYTVSITYNPTSVPTATSAWYSWKMTNEIYNAITTSTPLSIAWASMNESTQGWVYFAKSEFGSTYGPCVIDIWSLPALVGLTVPSPAHYNNGSGSATGLLTVNAIGLQGTALVYLSSSNTAVATVPASVTVTGLNRSFPIALVGMGTTTITATYDGLNLQAPMTVVNP